MDARSGTNDATKKGILYSTAYNFPSKVGLALVKLVCSLVNYGFVLGNFCVVVSGSASEKSSESWYRSSEKSGIAPVNRSMLSSDRVISLDLH